MNRKFNLLSIAASCAIVTSVVVTQLQSQPEDMLCSLSSSMELDTSKPLSHPDNYCAAKQQANLSWSSWLTGRSNANQFHYLDLLELLSRFSEDSSQNYGGSGN